MNARTPIIITVLLCATALGCCFILAAGSRWQVERFADLNGVVVDRWTGDVWRVVIYGDGSMTPLPRR